MNTSDRLKAIDNSQESWRASLSKVHPDDVTLMRLIRVASLGITAFTDPMLLEAGLTESSYHSLIVIVASGAKGITVTAVCDQVGQTRANMTRILKILEAGHLAEMRSDRLVSQDVVPDQSADGRFTTDPVMGSFEIVVAVPDGQFGTAFVGVLVAAGVSPLT
jgi:hypothetical protein